jgi:hypothetical protein
MTDALFKNNGFSTLASGITNVATTITLAAGEGTRFPFPTGSEYFYATLIDTSNNIEIVQCTTRATDTLTVVRAQEGTTGRAYSTGDRIELRLTAAGIAAIQADTTNVTAAGALMDSELTSIASVKALDQGVSKADNPEYTTGLKIGGSAAANLMDVFVKGTWTPVLTDGSNNATMTGTTTGRYTKIGNAVLIKCTVATSSLGTVAGAVSVSGLPFASENVTNVGAGIACAFASGLAITAGTNISGLIGQNSSSILLENWDDVVGTTALQGSEWTDNGLAIFTGIYWV